MSSAKRYSIYDRKTDTPIAIYRSSKECAEILGVKLQTFFSYIARQRVGKPSVKYEIYEDEIDKECEITHMGLQPPQLSDLDYEIILAMAECSMRIRNVARMVYKEYTTVWYHIDKIEKVTGLSPRNFADLKKLIKMAKERSCSNG